MTEYEYYCPRCNAMYKELPAFSICEKCLNIPVVKREVSDE